MERYWGLQKAEKQCFSILHWVQKRPGLDELRVSNSPCCTDHDLWFSVLRTSFRDASSSEQKFKQHYPTCSWRKSWATGTMFNAQCSQFSTTPRSGWAGRWQWPSKEPGWGVPPPSHCKSSVVSSNLPDFTLEWSVEWAHTQSGRIVKETGKKKKNTMFQLLVIALHFRQVSDTWLQST